MIFPTRTKAILLRNQLFGMQNSVPEMTSLEARCADCRTFKAQGATVEGKAIYHTGNNLEEAHAFLLSSYLVPTSSLLNPHVSKHLFESLSF